MLDGLVSGRNAGESAFPGFLFGFLILALLPPFGHVIV